VKSESFEGMPITNSLYGTDHPSKRKAVERPDKSVEHRTKIGALIPRATKNALERMVA